MTEESPPAEADQGAKRAEGRRNDLHITGGIGHPEPRPLYRLLQSEQDSNSVEQLRRRHAAAVRMPVLDDGRRDPDIPRVERGPSTYSLTAAELRRHAHDLQRLGWSTDEILAVLDLNAPVRHCLCCPQSAVSA